MKTVLPCSFQSVYLSASISLWIPSLSSPCIYIPPFAFFISSLFQSLLFHTFFHFSNHCEIARLLVGEFSDREIWLRSESLVSLPAFLSQFKWFCSFTGKPTQTARHTHTDTSLLCTYPFIPLSPAQLHTYKRAHSKHHSDLKVVKAPSGEAAAGRRGNEWKADRWSHIWVYH